MKELQLLNPQEQINKEEDPPLKVTTQSLHLTDDDILLSFMNHLQIQCMMLNMHTKKP
jgi:hypothetical protein